jgi:predicted dehydrogenase
MRRNAALADDYARRHGVSTWFADAQDLIDYPDVDAVYVATPPGSHREYALRALAAGKPCYVEKPMARNYTECAEMATAFADSGIPLFVAYYRRGLARFRKAKELVESGSLGTVTAVNYRYSGPSHARMDPQDLPWRVKAAESGGGLFLDLGSHTLDVFDYILGPLADVKGNAANIASPYAVEDSVAMTFTAGGALGAAAWNFASAVREDVIEITGTDGRILMSCFGNEPVKLMRGDSEEEFDLPNPPHIQQPLIQSIVDELLGRGRCPSTGDSAARTAKVMDSALGGYYGGRDDAFWEREGTWPGRRAL